MQCIAHILLGILLHVSRLHGSGFHSHPNDYNVITLFILLVGVCLDDVTSNRSLALSFSVALMPLSKSPSLSPATTPF